MKFPELEDVTIPTLPEASAPEKNNAEYFIPFTATPEGVKLEAFKVSLTATFNPTAVSFLVIDPPGKETSIPVNTEFEPAVLLRKVALILLADTDVRPDAVGIKESTFTVI